MSRCVMYSRDGLLLIREPGRLMSSRFPRRERKENPVHFYDYSLLFIIIFLLYLGLVMIYSASFLYCAVKLQIQWKQCLFYAETGDDRSDRIFHYAGDLKTGFIICWQR